MTWPTVKLGELATFLNGGTPAKSNPEFFRGDIPWITGADINGSDVHNARSFITEEAIRRSATNRVPKGTVLIVTRTSVGKVARAGVSLCFSQDITAVRHDESKLDASYLVHFLRTKQPHFERVARGATIKGVTREVLFDLMLPLPPLDEQRRIAAILDQAEELRAKRRAALALLDQLPQAIFLEMFGDPATNLKGWPDPHLSSLAETRLGKMLDKKKQSSEEPLPYIGNSNLRWFSFDLTAVQKMTFTEKERSILRLRAGDVLICEGGEPGRAAIWSDETRECYFQKAIHRVRPDLTRLLPQYLVHCMHQLAVGGGLKDFVTVATIAHLTGEKLRMLPIPLPPIDLQRTFASRVEAVYRGKTAQQVALAELDALLSSLRHSAFNKGWA